MSRDSNLTRTLLLRTLADGQFHSGEDLGQDLGLSRAAISKHIKSLTQLGLDIFSVTGKGYKLSKPLLLLSQSDIAKSLPTEMQNRLEVVNVIASTNQYVKERIPHLPQGYTCIAEAQTQGRGRHGRTWVSPYGASLYLSTYWQFAAGYQAINGLSLAMGVAIAQTLQQLNVEGVQLKWPNDVYLDGKKLAGVLIEVEGQMGVECHCVIGIGLNIDLPSQQDEIDQPWTDLAKSTGRQFDRNLLCATLLNQLYLTLSEFESSGLATYIEPWKALNLYADQPIRVLSGKTEKQGTCRGINPQGALLLETLSGIEAIHGGEVSVRGH